MRHMLILSFIFMNAICFSQPLPGDYERHKIVNPDSSLALDSIWVYPKASFNEAQFDFPIYFIGSKFQSVAFFNMANFDSLAVFSRARFNFRSSFYSSRFLSKTFFSKARFISSADFDYTKYDAKCSFNNVTFDSLVSFSWGEFRDEASFQLANFRSSVSFYQTEFDNLAQFVNVNFLSDASFERSQFDSLVYFDWSDFASLANFRYAIFNSNVSFNSVNFRNKLDLSESVINGIINFHFASLPDTIIMNHTWISGLLDFSYAYNRNDRLCYINFFRTNIDNLKLDYTQFKIMYSNGLSEDEIDKMYSDLLRVQDKYNFHAGRKKLDIEYQWWKAKWKQDQENIKIIEKKFPLWSAHLREWWDNFGYNKEYIFRNTAILLGVCLIVVWMFFREFLTQIYCPQSLAVVKERLKTYKWRNGFKSRINTLPYAAYYTLILFFGLKMNLENLYITGNSNWKKKLGTSFIFLVYGIGLVCTAYLANYVITR